MFRFVLGCFLLVSVGLANDNNPVRYQQDIAEIQRQITVGESKKSGYERQLSTLENKIVSINSQIKKLSYKLTALQRNAADLLAKRQLVDKNLARHKEELAQNLRWSYYLNRQDIMRHVFKRKDREEINRTLATLRFIQRQKAIAATQYQSVVDDFDAKNNAIVATQEQIKKTVAKLESKRAEFNDNILNVRLKLQDESSELDQNRREIDELQNLRRRLDIAIDNMPLITKPEVKFSTIEQPFPYPTTVRNFNSGLNGLLFNMTAQHKVYTIADGQIIFAQWLRGFGLLVIIDHGAGFMSLYGRNEVFYREVGEWLKAGDMIAKVKPPGLYFAIHRHGKPLVVKPSSRGLTVNGK